VTGVQTCALPIYGRFFGGFQCARGGDNHPKLEPSSSHLDHPVLEKAALVVALAVTPPNGGPVVVGALGTGSARGTPRTTNRYTASDEVGLSLRKKIGSEREAERGRAASGSAPALFIPPSL
jgi:hypothetical protein